MKFIAIIILVLLFCLPALAMGQNLKIPEPGPVFDFGGQWEVVSIVAAGRIVPVSEQTLFVSENYIAEYTNDDSDSGGSSNMHNVKWYEKNGLFMTRLYVNPAKSVGLDRFAEQNVAAYCYVRVRGDSGVMLITEVEMDGENFELEMGDFGRLMSIRRTLDDPGNRLFHAKRFISQFDLTKEGELNDLQQKSIGGWLEELKRNGVDVFVEDERDSSDQRQFLVRPQGEGRDTGGEGINNVGGGGVR